MEKNIDTGGCLVPSAPGHGSCSTGWPRSTTGLGTRSWPRASATGGRTARSGAGAAALRGHRRLATPGLRAPQHPREHVRDYFDIDESPYMMYIVECTERAAREIPAAVHADRTSRVQTVDADAPLGRIVERAGQLGLPPVLINTSFNISEPIVNSPKQAVSTFIRSPLASMYLDGYLVARKRP
jgi:hypothetical protein